MRNILFFIIITLTGCVHSSNLKPEDTKVSRSIEMQEEINAILAKDAEIKQIEKEYLEEIRIAQANNDEDAFRFFLREYVNVKRMNLPDWMKEEPNYVEGGIGIKY